ncbi:MAG: DivIVA domain-containing protein [Armatimonadota bacterium]
MAGLTPNDIVNKEFSRALRGYSTEQVDEFLQQISDTLFDALEENKRLRGQHDDLQGKIAQYQQTEGLITNALVLAERTADETRQHAHQEADLLRREAENQLQSTYNELDELRRTRARIIAELRGLLTTQLSLLETQEGRTHPEGERG